MTRYEDVLATVITEVVAPNAQAVDQQGSFPRASIDALAGIGLLGLVSSADVGGEAAAAWVTPPPSSSSWPAPVARRRWWC